MSSRDSRIGHLDATWEIAIAISCIIIFVAAISVVIYQVRRQKRLRSMKEDQRRRKSRERHGKDPEDGRRRVGRDLEKGAHVDDPGRDDDGDYTDIEDEEQPATLENKFNVAVKSPITDL